MNTSAHLGDDILNAWIDDAATGQEREIVRDHVATCDICLQRLEELQAVKAIFATLPEANPPRSFELTPALANSPTPIRPAQGASTIVRILPIVRTLSVAAMFAVLVLGGVLAFGPADDTLTSNDAAQTQTNETESENRTFQMQEAAPARGEVVDQGESASAHDSTSDALSDDGRETNTSPSSSGDGLTPLEIATIAVGALATIFGVTWIWMSMSIRPGNRR